MLEDFIKGKGHTNGRGYYTLYFLLSKSGTFQGCCFISPLFQPVGMRQNCRRIKNFVLKIWGEDFKVEDM